eukprot:TRINITY_DN8365_c0_g1_i2.p1 TRINITY_DN8365_c0_g1~~TRINITY_DN8365_c0_g1_i2.p1  ORF type:complete len:339 (+),score=55.89 TRINITY_DN8365_c0_g1_i2:102-1019(+)
MAAAFNRRDYWITQRLYPGIKLPCILGSDGSGVVVEVGDEKDKNWLNQDVVINANINWGPSEETPGPKYNILGMPQNGTFAEYLCTDIDRLHTKPSHLTYEQASAFPLAGLTGYRALFVKGGFQPKQRVLVTGIGSGVAQFIAQFAVLAGGEVWVTSSSPDKIAEAIQRLKVKGGFNVKDENWKKSAKKVGSFDLVVDGVGGKDFNKFIDLLALGGKLVTYGATAGLPDKVPIQNIFLAHKQIIGTSMGSDRDFQDLVAFVTKTQLVPPIDSVVAFKDFHLALERLKNGSQSGKLVLTFSGKANL